MNNYNTEFSTPGKNFPSLGWGKWGEKENKQEGKNCKTKKIAHHQILMKLAKTQ